MTGVRANKKTSRELSCLSHLQDLSFASPPPAGNRSAFQHLDKPPWVTRLLSCSRRQPPIQRVAKHSLPFVNPRKAISFLLTTSSKKNGVKVRVCSRTLSDQRQICLESTLSRVHVGVGQAGGAGTRQSGDRRQEAPNGSFGCW